MLGTPALNDARRPTNSSPALRGKQWASRSAPGISRDAFLFASRAIGRHIFCSSQGLCRHVANFFK
jgi:hypothetical protein